MELRPYQIDISNKANEILTSHKMVYLALETRTGKTITALETVKKYGATNILFVTKKKAIKSIEKDFYHYSDYFHLTVINFESVHKIDINPDLVIIDESHSLGAYPKPSKRAINLKVICMDKPIIYLSATPTPESHSQIFHQFYISSFSPFVEKSFYKWANNYVNKRERMINGYRINDYSDAYIDKIEEKIKHLFIAFTQEQAGFEYTIQESFLTVKMNEKQIKAIEILKRDRVLETKSGDVILADTAVKLQSKIHQICSGSVKDEDGNIHLINDEKAVYLREYFKGKKIAIFYKFIGEYKILNKVFKGDCTNDPEEFQESDNLAFLGQFSSAREGIRLDTADAIVFYNIDFSYLSYAQAKNRIVSKERTEQAILYWIFSENGIEEKIYKAVSNKSDYTNYYFKKDYGIKSASKAN